jgi:hypothetical protein
MSSASELDLLLVLSSAMWILGMRPLDEKGHKVGLVGITSALDFKIVIFKAGHAGGWLMFIISESIQHIKNSNSSRQHHIRTCIVLYSQRRTYLLSHQPHCKPYISAPLE